MAIEPKAPGADCESCPLQGAKMVPGTGPTTCKVVVVGEAPGVTEARLGKPFVGPSGELLRRTLNGYGIDDKDIYVTNAVLCHPARNKLPPKAVHCCRRRLLAEIVAHKPEVVLALGNTATHVLLGDIGGITTIRGRQYEAVGLKDIVVVPTLHPAAILRRPSSFRDFSADISKAFNRTVNSVSTHQGPVDRRIILDQQEAVTFLQHLERMATTATNEAGAPMKVTVDLETSGFDPFDDYILCIVFSWKEEQAVVLGLNLIEDSEVRKALLDAFTSVHIAWGGHGMKFDRKHLVSALGGVGPKVSWDTLLQHYMLDERKGTHDLKKLAAGNLNAPNWEGTIKQYLKKPSTDSYALLPESVLYTYALHDGDYTTRLRMLQESELASRKRLQWVYDNLLVPASNVLADIELFGARIDQSELEGLDDELTGKIFDLECELCTMAGDPGFNPNSTQQVGRIIFEKFNLPHIRGNSTDADVLEALDKKTGHPFVKLMRKQRKVAKLHSTYVKGIERQLSSDGRVRSSFMLHGTVTGRLSCRDPNLQNVPRKGSGIRRLYIPSTPADFRRMFKHVYGRVPQNIRDDDELVIMQGDYSQAELRVLAWITKDPFLLEVYRSGRDLHSEVAERMFGPEYTKEQRVAAKMVNFGLVYGRTARALARDTRIPGMSYEEAVEYINDFFRKMPRVTDWYQKTKAQVRRTGMVTSLVGRERRFGIVTQEVLRDVENQAVNFMCQSPASDFTLRSLCRMHEWCVRSGAAHILVTVHDSIILECPRRLVPVVGKKLATLMQSTAEEMIGDDVVPFPSDIEVGSNWEDLKGVKV